MFPDTTGLNQTQVDGRIRTLVTQAFVVGLGFSTTATAGSGLDQDQVDGRVRAIVTKAFVEALGITGGTATIPDLTLAFDNATRVLTVALGDDSETATIPAAQAAPTEGLTQAEVDARIQAEVTTAFVTALGFDTDPPTGLSQAQVDVRADSRINTNVYNWARSNNPINVVPEAAIRTPFASLVSGGNVDERIRTIASGDGDNIVTEERVYDHMANIIQEA